MPPWPHLTLQGAQEVSAKNEFEPPAFQAQAIVARAFQIKEARRRLTMSVCHAPPFCGQCASLVAEPGMDGFPWRVTRVAGDKWAWFKAGR